MNIERKGNGKQPVSKRVFPAPDALTPTRKEVNRPRR